MRLVASRVAALGVLCLAALNPIQAQGQGHGEVVPDVVYGHKSGMALTFDVFKPEGEANGAAILYMVSGGWISRWSPPDQARRRFAPLLESGFTVIAVRHGSSPKYNIPEVVEDVRKAVRYIKANAARWGVDPERLGVHGGSAGGHLSLLLAGSPEIGGGGANGLANGDDARVAAVVAYFPPTDLRPLVIDPSQTPQRRTSFPALIFDPALAASMSPIVHVTPDDPPTLFIHGDRDRLVPLANSESMLAELKEAGVEAELIVLEGAGHGFRGQHAAEASLAMVEWFTKHLTGGNSPRR